MKKKQISPKLSKITPLMYIFWLSHCICSHCLDYNQLNPATTNHTFYQSPLEVLLQPSPPVFLLILWIVILAPRYIPISTGGAMKTRMPSNIQADQIECVINTTWSISTSVMFKYHLFFFSQLSDEQAFVNFRLIFFSSNWIWMTALETTYMSQVHVQT